MLESRQRAIRGFTDSLRSELHRQNARIQVAMLQVPAVNTPQFEVVRSRFPKHPQPVPPIYQPEVIAQAALHAVPARSRYWPSTPAPDGLKQRWLHESKTTR